jgi:hypothetical protein
MRRLRRALAPLAVVALLAWIEPLLPEDTPLVLLLVPAFAALATAVLFFSGLSVGRSPVEDDEDDETR